MFTLVAILTLALGIGANTAVFTLLDQALLRCLPVQPSRATGASALAPGSSPGHTNSYGGDDNDFFSYPMYRDLRDKNRVLDGLIANDRRVAGVQWNNRSELAAGELVSGNYFEVLGVQPAMGRLIVPSDEAAQCRIPWPCSASITGKTSLVPIPRVTEPDAAASTRSPSPSLGSPPPAFTAWSPGRPPDVFVPMSGQERHHARAGRTTRTADSHWLTYGQGG